MAESKLKPGVRLYAILAREAPLAVVFRRGPSKQVLLVQWHTETDEFSEGQWLKGRIYERRCDLSPNGKRLIYFAANYKDPYYSWTAISKPPFLTAVALWPKGDCWGGGGQFAKETKILLNHRENEMALADGFILPESVKVEPFGLRPGWGEDSPIIEERLDRDGWQLIQSGNSIERESSAPMWIEIEPPEIWLKLNPKKGRDYELLALTRGIHERDGSFYVTEHMVVAKKANEKISLGRTDWADWCRSGDLLFAKDGKIFRLGFDGKGFLLPIGDAKVLIDLTDRSFQAKKAPDEARVWNSI